MPRTPTDYAASAAYLGRKGLTQLAHLQTLKSIKARAYWMMVNGKWVRKPTTQGA